MSFLNFLWHKIMAISMPHNAFITRARKTLLHPSLITEPWHLLGSISSSIPARAPRIFMMITLSLCGALVWVSTFYMSREMTSISCLAPTTVVINTSSVVTVELEAFSFWNHLRCAISLAHNRPFIFLSLFSERKIKLYTDLRFSSLVRWIGRTCLHKVL